MTDENNKDKKRCNGKGKAMFTYGILQLGSSLVSAIALTVIALSFCSLKKEAKIFNDCIEEVQANNKSAANAVHFCNGGNKKS